MCRLIQRGLALSFIFCFIAPISLVALSWVLQNRHLYEMAYIDTPEKLRKNAPDFRWVLPVEYPKRYKDSRVKLNSLRQRHVRLSDVVLKGDLTEAGIEFLGITPRVTVTGRVVITGLRESVHKSLSSQSRRQRIALVAPRIRFTHGTNNRWTAGSIGICADSNPCRSTRGQHIL